MFPGRYHYRVRDGIMDPIMSVNGSSEDGNCSLKLTTCKEWGYQLIESPSMDPLQQYQLDELLLLPVLTSLPVSP